MGRLRENKSPEDTNIIARGVLLFFVRTFICIVVKLMGTNQGVGPLFSIRSDCDLAVRK